MLTGKKKVQEVEEVAKKRKEEEEEAAGQRSSTLSIKVISLNSRTIPYYIYTGVSTSTIVVQ